MPACPYCQFEISEEYNFCLNCDSQVKCTRCTKLLIPGKTHCFVCGNSLVSKELPQTQMNEFTLEEKQTTKSAYRRINGRFSDDAFGQAAALFGGMSTSNLISQSAEINSPPQKLLPLPQDNQDEGDQAVEDYSADQSSTPLSNKDDKDRALRFFEVDGEAELVAKITDYKGKSKKEQQQRFILVYVWAFQHIFSRAVPSKEHINNAAKKSVLYDNNFANHFGQTSKEFLMLREAGYKINSPGIARVNEIIDEMDNSDLEGFAYWKGTSKTARKRSSLSKEDEQKIKQWLEMPTTIDQFDVRKIGGASNLAAFAIWIITKKLSVENAVKPKEAYSYLKGKYQTIAVTSNTFSMALSRNLNKFKKTPDGLYFLTEETQREVESWIQGAAIENTELEISDDEEEDNEE